MTADTLPAAHRRPLVRSRRRVTPESRSFRTFSVLFMLAASIGLCFASADVRVVLGPAVFAAGCALLYLTVQIKREGHLPIFEAATFFVIATAIYTIVPLLQFVLGGLQCGPWGDNRLYQWDPTPREFGHFAWRHAVLLFTFVAVYLPARGRRLWPARTPARPMRTTTTVIVISIIGISLFFIALRLYAGPGASVYHGGTAATLRPVPLFVQQIANVLQMVGLTLKQCLVILLLLNWNRRLYRVTLAVWLTWELGSTVFALESRAATVLLLLTVVVGYHQLVRPLRVRTAFTVGTAVLIGFLLFGLFRDLGTQNMQQDPHGIWGAATEFQILYGTAYDIHMRRVTGTLPPVPWQIYYSDFYRLIPSQLLPFYKWDPTDWYVDILGLTGSGQGFMFGVIAQSVVGFGYAELIVRAVILALFYAFAHRVYRRYSRSFWTTIGYLFILTWAYYAFRSTSLDILYRLVYYFLPTWFMVRVLTIFVTKTKEVGRRSAAAA
jgi:hypothetical protein